MKNFLDSAYLLYFCFFLMLLIMPFVRDAYFEPTDMSFIKQILHPEYPKGELSYDPHQHHNYIVAFAAKGLGLEDNLSAVAKIFWFLEKTLFMLVLIRLCSFLFGDNKVLLIIAFMIFILFHEGSLDQDDMVQPLYLLAIYYFLKEKWLISAIFGASLFYFHIGLAIWWFLPSFFGLAVIYLIQKRISLKKLIDYSLVVIILASPVICFYLWRVQTAEADEFLVNYYYFRCWNVSSILLTFSKLSVQLLNILLPVAIFSIGYSKARKSGYKNDNIIPIAVGVLIVYILTFVFVDILGNVSAIILNLLRSIINIKYFSSLFMAFLLARQIKRGNYIFFLIFVLLSFYWYNIMGKFLGMKNQNVALNTFYFVLLIYELFETHIFYFIGRIYKTLQGRLKIDYLGKITSKGHQLVQKPIVIAAFLIFVIAPTPPILKSSIKAILNIPPDDAAAWTAHKYLYNDIVKFTNEKIVDEDALLLIPFLETDFEYYTDHKVFITACSAIDNFVYKRKTFDVKNILENDLNYPPERLFENYSVENFYKEWERLWKNLNEDTIKRWKKKYKVTHVIRERQLPLNFPIIYQNSFYVIYEID